MKWFSVGPLIGLAFFGALMALLAEPVATEWCACSAVCWMDEDQEDALVRIGAAIASGALIAAAVRQLEENNRAQKDQEDTNRLRAQQRLKSIERLLDRLRDPSAFGTYSDYQSFALSPPEEEAISTKSKDAFKRLGEVYRRSGSSQHKGYLDEQRQTKEAFLDAVEQDRRDAEYQFTTGTNGLDDGRRRRRSH